MIENNKTEGYFLNGKAQIIEMLRLMSGKDRARLIQSVKHRNPSLAEELMEKCVSFRDLERLGNHELNLIFNHVDAPILGLALKGSPITFQRRVLSLAQREYAEKAYHVLVANISDEDVRISKAQERVLTTLAKFLKKQQIIL